MPIDAMLKLPALVVLVLAAVVNGSLAAQVPLRPDPLIEPAPHSPAALLKAGISARVAAAPEVDRPSSFGRAFVGASAGWAVGAAIGWGFAHARGAEQYGMIAPIMIGGAVGSGIGTHLRNDGRGSWPVNVFATTASVPLMIVPQMAICWEICEGRQVAAISAGYAVTQTLSAATAEWAVGRFRDR